MANRTSKAQAVRERLLRLHADGMSWRRIAALPEYEGVPAGSLCSFAAGTWEPKEDNDQRRRLGLSEVIVIERERLPDGTFAPKERNDRDRA